MHLTRLPDVLPTIKEVMKKEESIPGLLLSLANPLSPVEKVSIRDQLVQLVNHLLVHDFNTLVLLLYRIDVDEQKLKILLEKNPGVDAAILITDLLIKRQEEKIKTRQANGTQYKGDDEEKW
jgi:hypothetical protein